MARLPPPHRHVLEHARQLYRSTSYAGERWTDEQRAQAGPHVEEVLARIRAARSPRDAVTPGDR